MHMWLLQIFKKGIDKDMAVLMAARAARLENQDAIDTAIVSMLTDPQEVMNDLGLLKDTKWFKNLQLSKHCIVLDTCLQARAGIQEVHFLPFNPANRRTALTYLDGENKMHRVSKGAPEEVYKLTPITALPLL